MLRRRGPRAPVVAPARPQQRLPAAAARVDEARGGQDAIGRPVQARRLTGRTRDRSPRRARGPRGPAPAPAAGGCGDGGSGRPRRGPRPRSRRRAPDRAVPARRRGRTSRARRPAPARRASAGVPRGCGPSSKVSATAPASVERSRTASARRSAGDHAHSAGPACTVAAASAPAVSAALSWRPVMASIVLGVVAACTASVMYNLGVALQALEARVMPAAQGLRPSLIGDLAHRPRWLAGTALGVVGWPLQAAALLLAPLTVVQPALAFGLVLLLVLGARDAPRARRRARRAGRRCDHRRRRLPGGRRTAHVLASRRRLAAGPRLGRSGRRGPGALRAARAQRRGRHRRCPLGRRRVRVGRAVDEVRRRCAERTSVAPRRRVDRGHGLELGPRGPERDVGAATPSGHAGRAAGLRRPGGDPGARRAAARGRELGARAARGRRDHPRAGGGHRRRGGADGRAGRARARRRGAQQRRERDHAQPADAQRRGRVPPSVPRSRRSSRRRCRRPTEPSAAAPTPRSSCGPPPARRRRCGPTGTDRG